MKSGFQVAALIYVNVEVRHEDGLQTSDKKRKKKELVIALNQRVTSFNMTWVMSLSCGRHLDYFLKRRFERKFLTLLTPASLDVGSCQLLKG